MQLTPARVLYLYVLGPFLGYGDGAAQAMWIEWCDVA